MNIDSLAVFTDVYRLRSFTAVAYQRNVAPSSVSRTISSLETDLQTRLFQRTTRQLHPTEAGDRFFKRIKPLLEEFESARQDLRQDTVHAQGILKITASVAFGQLVLADLIPEFQRSFPDIKLELILTDQHSDLIGEGIDVAIRHGRLDDSSLIAKRLMTVNYRAVASPDYLAQNGPISHPDELSTQSIISFTYPDFHLNWVFRNNHETVEAHVSPIISTNNADAIRRCALAGTGIALLADWTVSNELQSGELVDLFPGWRGSGTNTDNAIWLVYPSRSYMPAKSKAFTEHLEATIKKGGR